MSKAENAILVHGAWADGSSWSKVIALLLERGIGVTAAMPARPQETPSLILEAVGWSAP